MTRKWGLGAITWHHQERSWDHQGKALEGHGGLQPTATIMFCEPKVYRKKTIFEEKWISKIKVTLLVILL